MKLNIQNPSELPEVAKKLIEFAPEASFFVIEGQMGAGKTTFIKSVCDLLGVLDVVSSPTFSIVNEYLGDKGPIYHFDFYRIKNLNEAYDIGYEEYFFGEGICFVEWAEKVKPLLPDTYVEVKITITGEHSRTFEFIKTSS
ncbi:tRNA (adenosine(37)-N6)-threonylcarbamoyltransferase complex ATPase subunit type 1 TsaE [Pedobacter flavus]|uniref:tRNA threonylcarbamoyladenosine biosynthesis protein TsaE n=1 Tax=Pedobacter flavus TaxID=3113906 RepID=A0ABU7GZH7_9SPHI|nr:tRNA (adenosine(37)-N6)-threonylcarbamoyltransferase complex ATPase subunit type 1 TsaE [Pedobacter sp. VNH31]MEE1884441.1 tRNA (adenosine(37)-N6)-threonylcarbamoyltransferase complex ATPase subunit type 1 TsaE [Pedobacter sp. VNH31]